MFVAMGDEQSKSFLVQVVGLILFYEFGARSNEDDRRGMALRWGKERIFFPLHHGAAWRDGEVRRHLGIVRSLLLLKASADDRTVVYKNKYQ